MLINKLAKSICIIACMCFLQYDIYAQAGWASPDTIRLSLEQAEQMFLQNNLQLVAGHYHIQGTEALVEQARKWDNPVLVTDQNVYANKAFFRHGKDAAGSEQGEVYVQVQQLIRTAGKRHKQADLASTNVHIAGWQFRQVMRDLRAELVKDLYTVAQLQGNAELYKENMQRLNKLLGALETELNAGNIARKEYLRVQALVVNLQHDITENAKSLNDAESELKTLLAITGNKYIMPVVNDAEDMTAPAMSLAAITDSAKQNNAEYRQQAYMLQYNQQFLRLQRALSVPDLTVAPEFDQSAGYTPNYYGLTLSLPVPLWDRNKGNIKAAKYSVKEGESLLTLADKKLENDVLNAYQKLLYTIQQGSNENGKFYSDYYQLQRNITESYNKRQISLVEFLEYYKDYKDIREQQLQQVLNLRLAKLELNDIAGTDIVPLTLK